MKNSYIRNLENKVWHIQPVVHQQHDTLCGTSFYVSEETDEIQGNAKVCKKCLKIAECERKRNA